MVSLNWSTAWNVWKMLLVGAGAIVLVGILAVYLDSFLLSILVVGVISLTVVLYRKGAGAE